MAGREHTCEKCGSKAQKYHTPSKCRAKQKSNEKRQNDGYKAASVKCRRCFAIKPRSEFGIRKNNPRRAGDHCEECRSDIARKRKAVFDCDRKRCSMCLEWLPLNSFYASGGRPRARCKSCHTQTHGDPEKKRDYRRAEAERNGRKFVARDQDYYRVVALRRSLMNDRRSAIVIAKCGWKLRPQWLAETFKEKQREANRMRCIKRFREWYSENPEAEKLRVRRYKHANPWKVRKWGDARWDRAAHQSDGSLTKKAVDELLANAKRCLYCAVKLNADNATIDHMIPLKLGGLHSTVNVVACCRACNSRKRAKSFANWVKSLDPVNAATALRLYRRRYGCDPEQQSLLLTYKKPKQFMRQ